MHSRVELVVAAIRHRTALAAHDPPDTGTLRGDVFLPLLAAEPRTRPR
jgi:hypothetical protein